MSTTIGHLAYANLPRTPIAATGIVMQINPNPPRGTYSNTSTSGDGSPKGSDKPASPVVTPSSQNPFAEKRSRTASSNSESASESPATEQNSSSSVSGEQTSGESTKYDQVDGKPNNPGPLSTSTSNLPGRPTNPALDNEGNLYDRALAAAPPVPDPETFVSDKLRAANNPDDPGSLDPEHTYLGYRNQEGQIVLGGSMLKYAMTQGLEGAPDGKDASELTFFKVRDGKHIDVKEDDTTTVSPHDVTPVNVTPKSVKNFSWAKDYHDAYSKAMNDAFDKYGLAMQGNFKINFLQKLEQEQNAGLITSDDRRIAARAMGLNGDENYSQLTLDDLKDKPPQSDVQISPLTINGHQAVNALVMTDPQSGRTVLYLGGMNGPFHGFASKDEMWNWICDKVKDPKAAQELGRYFPDAAKQMPELFQRMGKEGGMGTRNLLEFPGAQMPPGRGLGYYEVEKNRGVMQRLADESLVTQGEVQRGEFSDALQKGLGIIEPLLLAGGSRGAAVGLIGKLGQFGFDIRQHSVAIRSEERNEWEFDAFDSGKDHNYLKGAFKPKGIIGRIF